jgi:hypothetical protein
VSKELIETRRIGLINTLKGFAIGDNYKTPFALACEPKRELLPLSPFLCCTKRGLRRVFTAVWILPRSFLFDGKLPFCERARELEPSADATNSWMCVYSIVCIYSLRRKWLFIRPRRTKRPRKRSFAPSVCLRHPIRFDWVCKFARLNTANIISARLQYEPNIFGVVY